MRYLGIDYGTKRVGLAISDEAGKIAFPFSILDNRANLIEQITKICVEKKVAKIVLGESLNYQSKPNLIMAKILDFKKHLAEKLKLEIIFEPEWLTSALATRSGGADDSAAALILQTHLDRL